MRTATSTFGLLLLVVAACSDPVQPENALSGTWSTGRMDLDASSSWEVELTFSHDGEFTQRVTMYGLYQGQSDGERSAVSVFFGTYSVEGTELSISPSSYQWWDQFYEDPGPYSGEPPATLYPDCTFELKGLVLTLRYTSYPADAPVASERSFYRSL